MEFTMNQITRIPFILASSGMDSALLIQDALLNCNEIDVLYVEVGDDAVLIEKEISTLRKTIKAAEAKTGHRVNLSIRTSQPFVAINDADLSMATRILIAAIALIDPNRHSVVRMGSCSGDSIARENDKLSRLWFALNNVSKYKPVPLEFPLKPYSKLEVLTSLSPETVAGTWSCELPYIDACGKCSACKAIKNAYGEFYRKNGRNYHVS